MEDVRLLVVSNRLPFVLQRNPRTGKLERKTSAGGLVTAVAPVVSDCNGLWVGWPGMHLSDPDEPIPESPPGCKAPTAKLLSRQIVPVDISQELFDAYYNGCCNGTLWPLFHSMPGRAEFRTDTWKAYLEVNQLFADKLLEACAKMQGSCPAEGCLPIVWIHDYQLMILASNLREKLEERNLPFLIGFFLHIPFPPWDIFRIFPWDDEVLQGMLGCDLVAFHIEDYCLNFLDCCQRILGCRVDRRQMLVELGGKTTKVRALPIGIPYEQFAKLARSATPVIEKEEGNSVVLGVDRMDYTKGLVHRLKGFERLLELHPEHLGHVTFLQIAVPSRTDIKEYKLLKEDIDQLTGEINGRFSTPNWSPIRYIFRGVTQEELAAYYRDASVALVTPLRDGMNLVAKEYVASQTDRPGVLILSPFAGAGQTMLEALMVNPYEKDEVAEAIHRALTMTEDEKAVRMHQLQLREKQWDVDRWMRSFLAEMRALAGMDETHAALRMKPLSIDDFDFFFSDYMDERCKLLLLLDYDGTLAPFAPRPELALMPSETKRVLQRLCSNPDVHIAIISGRVLSDIMAMVDMDGVTYAGINGLEIMQPDGTKFVHPVPLEWHEKLNGLMTTLEEYCHHGAWLENKGVSISYHVREVPSSMQKTLLAQVKKKILEVGLLACDAACAVQARPPIEWDQGRACIYILRTIYGLDWAERVKVIYAGDDSIDEESIQALKGIAWTFRVTHNPSVRTQANRRLYGTDDVLTMLKWLERKMNSGQTRSRTSSLSKTLTNSLSKKHSQDENDIVICDPSFAKEPPSKLARKESHPA